MKDIWINLPVKDILRSTQFFEKVGFKFNPHYTSTENSASLMVGQQNVVIMLFEEQVFNTFTFHKGADTSIGTEVLFSIGLDSREEIDQMAEKVKEAGGTIFLGPAEMQNWMYSFGFIDLDGHRWNALYMDISKMPGA